uniref:hypothetical protein n=2 Tax=Algoriphagus sp. TaxID=1872435 RepID=UPI0040479EDC
DLYVPRILTSSFFNQRSVFDITRRGGPVFRLPTTGRYLAYPNNPVQSLVPFTKIQLRFGLKSLFSYLVLGQSIADLLLFIPNPTR